MAYETLITATETAVRADPRWALFQRGFGRGWQIRFRIMEDDERINWTRKIIDLAMFRDPDPVTRAAHAAAHLRLHWGVCRPFTDDEEDQADGLAACWLSWLMPRDATQWSNSEGTAA